MAMNLYRIGSTVLNMDRVNGIQDQQAPADPAAPAGRRVIRVLFDGTTIDLVGEEARTFRQWFRHAARSLVIHKDEDGEDLISPEEQLKRLSDHVLALVDRARPRDSSVRSAVHRLSGMVDEFITGELQHVRAKNFEKSLEGAHVDAQHDAGSSSVAASEQG
jgi:hypothetical protein